MSKRCAKCEKIVYPTEELKCLDKTWHKACFRCTQCSMALNMKNYKGYDKKPYCNAHYPTTKHTQVAETPEMARLAQNTRLQSNIQYHGEYEKAKGKCTSIADDPETKRILQNTQKISTITYTGQHEKDRGKYTSIVDDSEIQRLVKNSEKFSLAKYHEDFERNIKGSKIQVTDDPETLRHKANTSVVSNVEYTAKDRYQDGDQPRHSRVMGVPTGLPRAPASNGSVGMRKNPTYPLPSEPSVASPYSDRSQGHSTAYTTDGKVEQQGKGRVGSIHDFDPLNENFGSLNSGYNPNMPPRQGSMSQGQQQWEETVTINQMPQKAPAEPTTPPPPHHSEPEHHYPAPQPVSQPQPSYQPAMPPAQAPVHHPPQPVQPPPNPEPPAPQAPPQTTNPMTSAVFQAMYDYDAQDDDEISFIDGDLLIECQQIDDGWMFGTVRRTGARGMLPANYVERVQ